MRIGDETRRDHKLKTVYLHVGGSMEGIRPHDAGGDCLMMRGVWNAVRRERGLGGRTLRAVLAFQKRAAELQRADWEAYGGTTPDGAVFLWLRTCRRCLGSGTIEAEGDPSDNMARHWCPICRGIGVLNHTKKRRGTPVEPGYTRWCLDNIDNLPDAVRAKFEEVTG